MIFISFISLFIKTIFVIYFLNVAINIFNFQLTIIIVHYSVFLIFLRVRLILSVIILLFNFVKVVVSFSYHLRVINLDFMMIFKVIDFTLIIIDSIKVIIYFKQFIDQLNFILNVNLSLTFIRVNLLDYIENCQILLFIDTSVNLNCCFVSINLTVSLIVSFTQYLQLSFEFAFINFQYYLIISLIHEYLFLFTHESLQYLQFQNHPVAQPFRCVIVKFLTFEPKTVK